MKIFITEERRSDGMYSGPEIEATSWEEAQRRADACGVTLVGELAGVICMDGPDSKHAKNLRRKYGRLYMEPKEDA